jgi:hypothetical protein
MTNALRLIAVAFEAAARSFDELTFVFGHRLLPVVRRLDVVSLLRLTPRSSREQPWTNHGRRFGRDSFYPRSES